MKKEILREQKSRVRQAYYSEFLDLAVWELWDKELVKSFGGGKREEGELKVA